MPLLGSLILGLFSGFAGFFAQWLTRKVAIVVAAVSAFGVLSGALFFGTIAAINGLVVAFPSSPALLTGLYLCVPDNAPTVVAACLSFDAVLAVYRWNLAVLRMSASAA